MTGPANSGRNRDLILGVSAGVLSGCLYLTYLFSFAFLVPVQQSYSARGRKSGLLSSAAALATVGVGQAGTLGKAGGFDALALGAGIVVPLLFLLALAFVNAKVGKLADGTKLFIAAMAMALLATPLVLMATSGKAYVTALAEYVGQTMKHAGFAVEPEAQSQLEAAVLKAIDIVRSSYSAFILWMLAANWWAGSRIAKRVEAARAAMRGPEALASEAVSAYERSRLSSVRVPQSALWPTLISWAFLLGVLATKTAGTVSVIAWNVALLTASLYAMQGMGIVSYFARLSPAARLVRFLVPLAVLAVALNATAGTIVLIALPVLGITEVWFPYRNPKGALE